jgi:hypothetical protein
MALKNTYQARKRFTKTPVKSTGMWYQEGDVVVPSNQITMKGPQGQPNYFNSPILGVGMQSGQQQVMQPGREYLFPNDQSVFETKMQKGGWLEQYQVGGEKSTEQNPVRMNPINVKGKMPKVNWYESIDPRNWGLRDYSTVDDYSTAYNRAKLSGQDEFYWKGKRYNTKYAGPINEEIATYGVKGQKVDPNDYITVYQYPYLDKDYLPSHIAADQSAQISKLAMSFSDSNWDKSKKFFDYFQTQIQPNTPYRTRSDEESLLHFPPVVNYGLRGNMQTIQNDMSLPNRKEYRVYGVDPVTFFKKSNNLDKEVYKDIGYNWNLITNNCADNVCDAFGVPRDRGITTPQDAVDKIKNKYPTLEVTGRSSQSVYKYGGLQQSYKKTKRFK